MRQPKEQDTIFLKLADIFDRLADKPIDEIRLNLKNLAYSFRQLQTTRHLVKKGRC